LIVSAISCGDLTEPTTRQGEPLIRREAVQYREAHAKVVVHEHLGD
jgi:hypothetical protein